MKKLIGGVLLVGLMATPAWGQSFSCPIGKQPSCLGYGDKVVDNDAKCFTSYQCDFNGFMCVSDHDTYVKKAKAMASNYDDFKRCVANSADMEAIQYCLQRDNLR